MFKKTAAAYGLAQKFLEKGDASRARLAMDIGDRFQKIAINYTPRWERLHPAIVGDDLEEVHRNLDLMSNYMKKVQERASRIDPAVFSGTGTTGRRNQGALRHIQELQGTLDALKSLTSTNRGRKSAEANMALEHLKDIVEEDIRNGLLDDKDARVMKNYIMHLQPRTGLEKDKEFQFKTPPGEKI
jgi:hypothetical protein